MIVALPAMSWYLTICVQHHGGALMWPTVDAVWSHVQAPTGFTVGFYLAWVGLQSVLQSVLPGKTAEGEPLADGRRLPYRMNGLLALVVTLGLAIVAVVTKLLPATILYDHFGAFVTTTNIIVVLLCIYIFLLGRHQATAEEQERHPIDAFVVGATLNPRNGRFDWKFFCESRPGMILWVLINLSFVAAQYNLHGSVTASLVMVCAFQILYVTDYFVVEPAILSTWDIRHEPFGWMLCWGSLVWVPFTYSLQGLYLVGNPVALPLWAIIGITALNLAGYFIFRTSNLQKHRFRADPSRPIWGRTPEFIQTKHGTKLLVSGWWGVARHSNYLGDLMMGLAWCLACGFGHVLPYFYIIYFTILLLQREWRDSKHCAAKYGDDWVTYRSRVRWRIVPGLY